MMKTFIQLQKGLTRSKMAQNSRKQVKFNVFRLKSKIRPGHRVLLTKIHIFFCFPVIYVQIKGSRLSQARFVDIDANRDELIPMFSTINQEVRGVYILFSYSLFWSKLIGILWFSSLKTQKKVRELEFGVKQFYKRSRLNLQNNNL